MFALDDIALVAGSLVGGFMAQTLGIAQLKRLIRSELAPLKRRVDVVEADVSALRRAARPESAISIVPVVPKGVPP